jgi:F0F1-type ATP synthase membrane subunit a
VWSYVVATPLLFFELCVFLVQSFVFTYLVGIYFEE